MSGARPTPAEQMLAGLLAEIAGPEDASSIPTLAFNLTVIDRELDAVIARYVRDGDVPAAEDLALKAAGLGDAAGILRRLANELERRP